MQSSCTCTLQLKLNVMFFCAYYYIIIYFCLFLFTGSMRYVSKEPPAPRTSELVIRDMQLSLRMGIIINGIKGPSPLMNLPGGFLPLISKEQGQIIQGSKG